MQPVKCLSIQAFSTQLEQHIEAGQPFVVRQLVAAHPVVQHATKGDQPLLDYLVSLAAPQQVGIGRIEPQHQGRLFYNQDFSSFNFQREMVDFQQFLAELSEGASSVSSNQVYLGSTNVTRLLPDFIQHNNIAQLAKFNPLVNVWLSNPTTVAIHQDFPDNIACCIAGQRTFTLFPPEQIDNLYIGPIDNTPAGQAISLVNLSQPDLERFPKFEEALATAQQAELTPGDILFVPSLWWHGVSGSAPINMLVNYWWQSPNSAVGSPMDALMHGLLTISHLTPKQKQAMKAMFEHYVFAEGNEHISHIPENALGVLNSDSNQAKLRLRAMLLNKLNR